MKSILHISTLNNCLKRIDQLDSKQKPLWGKMSVDQMLIHCKKPLELAVGDLTLPAIPWLVKLFLRLFSKRSFYNNTPWKKNLPTLKEFKVKEHYDVEKAKLELKELLITFHHKNLNNELKSHPYLGVFSQEQWGKVQFKHLDHHLKQFGV